MLLFISFTGRENCLNKYLDLSQQANRTKRGFLCGVFSVENLKFPQWHLVPCTRSLNLQLFCTRGRKANAVQLKAFLEEATVTCWKKNMLFQSKCYSVQRFITGNVLMASDFTKEVLGFEKYVAFYHEFSVILKYLSLVSHAQVIFGFPVSATPTVFQASDKIANRTHLFNARKLYYLSIHTPFSTSGPHRVSYDLSECKKPYKHFLSDFETLISLRRDQCNPFNKKTYLTCFEGKRTKVFTKCMVRGQLNRILVPFTSTRETLFYKFDKLSETFVKAGYISNLTDVWFVAQTIQETTPLTVSNLSQIHLCQSKEYVSVFALYNGKADCDTGDDEVQMSCFLNGDRVSGSQCNTGCHKANCSCLPLFYQGHTGGCHPFRTTNGTHARKEQSTQNLMNVNKTKSKAKLHAWKSWQGLLPGDCSEYDFKFNQFHTEARICKNTNEMLCTSGCSRCFPVHKLCVFELDLQGILMHCPSGSHLKNCDKMGCNQMIKCAQGYCVPYKWVFCLDSCFHILILTFADENVNLSSLLQAHV